MIETTGLRVTFGRTIALDSIDLTIGPGVTGLFGQNGSGKTTLLRALTGLLRPTSGDVALDGAPPRAAPPGAIGYVGHSSGLYGRLTIEENLELFGRLHGIDERRRAGVIAELDLTRWAATRVGELSAGLACRAAVARAILHEPRYLFLDEPYANLDDDAASVVSAAIANWKGPERHAIVATHGAKRVKSYADGGVILQRGRVVRQGAYVHEEAGV